MDKKALLSRLCALYDELGITISDTIPIYENNIKLGETIFKSDMPTSDDLKMVDELYCQELEKAGAKIWTMIKKTEKILSDKELFSAYPSLKMLINKKEDVKPIAFTNASLKNTGYDLAEELNRANELKQKLEKIIEKIEMLPDSKIEQIISIRYLPEEHTLVVNDNNILIGNSVKYDLLLRAFFNEQDYSLLSGQVCDGDIYSLAEDDGLLIDKSKAEKRKYVLDGYKLLNDKIRRIIPDGKDLVIRVENGFILNPDLKNNSL